MDNSSGLPGVGAVLSVGARTLRSAASVARWSERTALGLLEARLEAASRPALPPAPPGTTPRVEGLNSKLGRLLRQAVDQTTLGGQQELFHKILDQLVPDEARIVGALSDGSASPLVNVYRRTRGGLVNEVVLENMSLVGKTANLALSAQTPTYVSHLLTLGLVEIGPEDPALKVEYEILCADTAVLKALKEASRGPVPARVERQTLRLSGLGLALWAAASDENGATGE
ncbi:MAG: Abi-alpha family protein [Marmoricola sp.]